MNTSVITGIQYFLRSRNEVSKAASNRAGATNRASVRWGSRLNDGAFGMKASAVPPSASMDGYGRFSRRATAARATAQTSRIRSDWNRSMERHVKRSDSPCPLRQRWASLALTRALVEVFAGEGAIDAECRACTLGRGHDGELHVANDIPRDEHTGHTRGLVVA